MIIYNKRYKHIIQLFNDTLNLIIKLPKTEDELSYLSYEYYIYKLIDHPAFNSYYSLFEYNNINYDDFIMIYDNKIKVNELFSIQYNQLFKNKKINMLIGNYNENMITLYNYCKDCLDINILVKVYINVLYIIDDCFIKFNFIHGDLKSNNILIDQTNPQNNIKLIDFEFSLILNNEIINIEEGFPLINLYLLLDDESIITKEFARIFDIYELCVDFLYNCVSNKLFEFKINFRLLLKNMLDENILSNTHIDFFIILNKIIEIPKYKLISHDLKILNISFNSIIINLLEIESFPNDVEIIQNRIKHIKTVLNKMLELNLLLD